MFLLLLTGALVVASSARAEAPRIAHFRESLLATCDEGGLVGPGETPDVSRSAGEGEGTLGDGVNGGTVLESQIPATVRTAWKMFAGPMAQPAPGVSHPPCAEPSTGPPAL